MNILFTFPRRKSLLEGNADMVRVYREKFTEYLQLAKEMGCTVEYFLEDSVAHTLVKELGLTNVKVKTAICPMDINFLKRYPEYIDFEPYVLNEWESAEYVNADVVRRFKTPVMARYETKEEFYEARVKNYKNRYKFAINTYINNSTNIVSYVVDGSTLCRNLHEKVFMGDGKLLVYENIDSYFKQIYFSGVAIDKDMLIQILSQAKGAL